MTAAPEPEYYRILNVHHQADPDIIEEAYHRLREKYKGATAAERDLDAAYAVLGDPDKRAAYDARRLSARRSLSTPQQSVTKPPPKQEAVQQPPKREVMHQPPHELGSTAPDRQTVPARCSVYGDGFDIVLLRAKGPYARFRVVGFEAWLTQDFEPESLRSMLGRWFKPKPATAEPANQPEEYLEFSQFEFGAHRCPICEGEAPPYYGSAVRWAMCGRCDHILCMGAADEDPKAKAITCPWCATTLRFGGAPTGSGRVKASQKLPTPPDEPRSDKPHQLPKPNKHLPKG